MALLVKAYSGKYTDGYMQMDDSQYIVVKHRIADPDSPQGIVIMNNETHSYTDITIDGSYLFVLSVSAMILMWLCCPANHRSAKSHQQNQ